MLPKNPMLREAALTVLEKHVERDGDKFMENLGFTAVRLSQSRASRQTPGIPDRKYYHLTRGITLWWEAKRPKGVQSFKQKVFQEMAQQCGEVYALGGVEELKNTLVKLVRDRGIKWKSVESLSNSAQEAHNS